MGTAPTAGEAFRPAGETLMKAPLLGLLVTTLPIGSGPLASDPRPPNVIHVLLDELGYYELSLMGHAELRTPHIDRLAEEGVRFTQLLAGAPVCAPTRCALLTGKHAGHMSIRDNGADNALRAGEATIATMLKQAGYATGGFGKWGCGARGTSGVPEEHGFDLFFGYYDQVHAHTYFPRYLVRNSQEVPLAGNTGDPTRGETFSHTLVFEETKAFIRAHADEPFYAYCAWTPPHGLWGIPEDDPSWQLYKDEPWTVGQLTPEDARIYAAMVHMVDRQVGELRALLEELGIADRTILFVSGDNGAQNYFEDEQRPEGIFAPNVDPTTGVAFRGYKRSLYEGGLRIPFIAHGAGRFPGGRVSDHLGYFPDMMATLADLCAAPCPQDSDGISFAPTLLGREGQQQHAYLYWEFEDQTAVRMGRWKAIRIGGNDPPWQLYDLDRDVSESVDVAQEHPEVVETMAAMAVEAHEPIQPGEVLDPVLARKDRAYWDGR